MWHLKKRFLALVLGGLLAFSLLPANVNALAAGDAAEQIGPYYEADDAAGTLPDLPGLAAGETSQSYASGFVLTDKTISTGAGENEFLITLDVRTKSVIENIEFSEDAAVVLVLDLSSSMQGGRLASAKAAALAFVNDFARTEGDAAQRKIAVVGFSGRKQGGFWNGRDQIGPIEIPDGVSPEDGDTQAAMPEEDQTTAGGMVFPMPLLRGPAAIDPVRSKIIRAPENTEEPSEGQDSESSVEQPDNFGEESDPGAAGQIEITDPNAPGSGSDGERPDTGAEGEIVVEEAPGGEDGESQGSEIPEHAGEPQEGQENVETEAPSPTASAEENAGGELDADPSEAEDDGENETGAESPLANEEAEPEGEYLADAIWGEPAAKTYIGWRNAEDGAITAAINSMSADGGTCLQAGLILANNLLNSGEVSGITNKNIIVLTDGEPTYYLSEAAAQSGSTTVVGQPSEIMGTGTGTDHDTHTKTESTARAIIGSGVNVYGVYLGGDTVRCTGRGCGLNKSGASWLRENCGMITYAVGDASGLSAVFQSISELIRLQASAWIATDPLGEMFEFAGFEREPTSENEYYYNFSEKAIQWNLRLSSPAAQTEDGFSIYRLTYKVKLNTFSPAFQAGTYYPTNGVTSVTYLLERGGQGGASELENGTAYFNVPSAKGYAGNIVFRKTDDKGQPLTGAVFGLYTDGALIETAGSGEDGVVTFAEVPSGHSYTIVESEAPEGFVASAEEYRVDIAYGEVRGFIGEDNVVVNAHQIEYGALTVSKTVSGPGASMEDGFAFTVTLDDKSMTGAYGDMVFENGVASFTLKANEQVTASAIPAGTSYTVTEAETEGYTATVNGESKSTEEGTITAGTTAVAAFDNFYDGGRIDPEMQYGSLIVSKTISGEGADPNDAFTFIVTLGNRDINGVHDQMEFVNGVAELELRGGESATASGLDAGTEYTVTEKESEGYTVTANGERRSSVSGTIVAGEITEAVFDNYRGGLPAPSTAELPIKKTVEATGDVIPDWNSWFSFVVSTSLKEDDAVAMPAVDMAGVGTECVSTDIDLSDLPLSLYVWERAGHEEDDGYGWTYDKTAFRVTFSQDEDSGEIVRKYEKIIRSGDEPQFEVAGEIHFTNTYYDTSTPFQQTGNLEITKTVSRGDLTKAFEFTVTLDERGISGKYGDVEFIDGVAAVRLKHGESVTAEGLPAGVGYAVEEVGSEGYTVTVNGADSSAAEGAIIAEHTVTEAFQNELDDGGTATPEPSQSPEPSTPSPSQSPAPTATSTPPGTVPATGDDSHIGCLILAVILCAASLASIVGRSRLFSRRRWRR